MANAGTIKIGVKVDANKIKTEFNVVKSEVANAKDGINSLFQGFSSGSLNSISSGLSGVSSSIGQLTSMAGLAIGPLAIVAASFTALGAAALAASIKITDLGIKGIGMLDELGDRAGKVSVLASELYLLENSAKLLGDEVSDVAPAIGKMTKALGDDKIGSVVAKLGLDLNRLRTQSPGETFRQLADAISQIENPTMRAKIGFELFGKSYMGLANTLSSGQIGFTIKELERLGLTLTDQDIVAAGEAQRSFDLLSMSFQRLTMLIGAELAPALNALSVAFMRIVQNAEFGEVIKYLADITVESVATILDAFYYMNLAIKALGLTMKSVVKSMEHGMAFMGGFAGQLLVAAKQVYSAISELDKRRRFRNRLHALQSH